MSHEKIASQYALQKAADLIKQAGIPGLRGPERLMDFAHSGLGGAGNITAKYEIAFAVEVSLYVRLNFTNITRDNSITPEVSIACPATQRTIPQQVALNSLLNRITDLAAIIQVHLDSYEIGFLESTKNKEK